MNTLKRFGTLIVLATVIATASLAAGRVAIHSAVPTRLFLDGQLLGTTPLQLSQIGRGRQTILAQNVVTGEQKVFELGGGRGRRGGWGTDAVIIEWPQACAPVRPLVRPVRPVIVTPLPRPYPVHPVSYGAPVVRAPVAYDPYETYLDDQERSKVRTRNTLLGAAVANEAFNRGNSRDLIRGATLGGAILNEIVR